MRNFVEAIREKFDESEHDCVDDGFIQVFVPKSGPHSRSVETGKLHLPERLTLDHLKISTAGDGNNILELCERVRELDLTKNVLTDWKEVFTILENCPHLHFINLTMNPLDNETFEDCPTKSLPNITDIALNGTQVSWPVIAKLLTFLPNLTELHTSLNKYTCVDLPDEFTHTSLKKLFVNSCDISNWSDISVLGKAFPSLQTLNIIETKISTLSLDDNVTDFPSLSVLNVSKCQIASWEEVEKFRRFPSLTNLRISDIPLQENLKAKERRRHFIARLPNICQLNGSNITETERDEAERAFIRCFLDSLEKPARYHELIERHGELGPLATVKFERPDYVKLLVKFEGKEEEMDVYLHQTVRNFLKLLCNFTGLPVQQTSAFYVGTCHGEVQWSQDLKLSNRKLLNWHMFDGDEIHLLRKQTD